MIGRILALPLVLAAAFCAGQAKLVEHSIGETLWTPEHWGMVQVAYTCGPDIISLKRAEQIAVKNHFNLNWERDPKPINGLRGFDLFVEAADASSALDAFHRDPDLNQTICLLVPSDNYQPKFMSLPKPFKLLRTIPTINTMSGPVGGFLSDPQYRAINPGRWPDETLLSYRSVSGAPDSNNCVDVVFRFGQSYYRFQALPTGPIQFVGKLRGNYIPLNMLRKRSTQADHKPKHRVAVESSTLCGQAPVHRRSAPLSDDQFAQKLEKASRLLNDPGEYDDTDKKTRGEERQSARLMYEIASQTNDKQLFRMFHNERLAEHVDLVAMRRLVDLIYVDNKYRSDEHSQESFHFSYWVKNGALHAKRLPGLRVGYWLNGLEWLEYSSKQGKKRDLKSLKSFIRD